MYKDDDASEIDRQEWDTDREWAGGNRLFHAGNVPYPVEMIGMQNYTENMTRG